MKKFLNITEVSNILKLTNPKNSKPLNHILRYWEKEFKQIKPKMINNRRYYSNEQIEIIKMIKFLLKNEGLTIAGVKHLLNSKINKLDDTNIHSLKAGYLKDRLKLKSKLLLDKIKKIRSYGKKNTS
tara:strand:- start:36 stop:416 length:381 start_codon:yes stop_codon:yes gene_type:complete